MNNAATIAIIAPAPRGRTDRRGQERAALDREGVLRIADQSFPVRVADLTRDGCRIDLGLDLAREAPVTVGIAGVGQVPARLVWRSERGYGCAFDRSLPPGAITAAFSPSNVVRLADALDPSPTRPVPIKLSGRARLGVLLALIALSWGLVAIGVAVALSLAGFGR